MIKVTIEPPKERIVTIELTESDALKLKCYVGAIPPSRVSDCIENNIEYYYENKFNPDDVNEIIGNLYDKLDEVINN